MAPFRRVSNALSAILPDVLCATGLGALAYGLHDIYPPSAWVVCGLILMAAGIRAAR